MDKIEFLRKSNKSAKILTPDHINKINSREIPAEWLYIFRTRDKPGQVQMIKDLWRKNAGKILRNTCSYLTLHLLDVDLIECEGTYSILYTINNYNNKRIYYQGGNPLNPFNNDALARRWNRIPLSIRTFYETFHNGFYDYASKSMGLMPIESVIYLAEKYDWGILEHLEEPLQLNLETSFGFFADGTGSYIAVDYTNCINDNATFWSSKKQPRYNIHFWRYTDEWTEIPT